MEPVGSSTPLRRLPPWGRVLVVHAVLLYLPFVWLFFVQGHESHIGWWFVHYPVLPGLPAIFAAREWLGDTDLNEAAGMAALTVLLLALPTWWARRGSNGRVAVTAAALGLYGVWTGCGSYALFVM